MEYDTYIYVYAQGSLLLLLRSRIGVIFICHFYPSQAIGRRRRNINFSLTTANPAAVDINNNRHITCEARLLPDKCGPHLLAAAVQQRGGVMMMSTSLRVSSRLMKSFDVLG